jgi:hypothetical protein
MDDSFNYPKMNKHQNKNRNDISNSDDEEIQKISFSCRYFWSLTGLLRLAIIVNNQTFRLA